MTTDDRQAIHNDLLHLDTVIGHELHALDREVPPAWQRLTRRQYLDTQRTMVTLANRLRGMREEG